MPGWMKDPRVQFAVGLGLVVTLLYCMFAGSFHRVSMLMADGPPNGKTAAGETGSVVTEFLVQGFVGVAVAIGGYFLSAVFALFSGVRSALSGQTNAGQGASDQSAVNQPTVFVGLQGLNQEIVMDLGRAALGNDQEKMELIRWQLRKPQAIKELAEAYDEGDLETVQARKTELDAMLGVATKPRKGGGSSGK